MVASVDCIDSGTVVPFLPANVIIFSGRYASGLSRSDGRFPEVTGKQPLPNVRMRLPERQLLGRRELAVFKECQLHSLVVNCRICYQITGLTLRQIESL